VFKIRQTGRVIHKNEKKVNTRGRIQSYFQTPRNGDQMPGRIFWINLEIGLKKFYYYGAAAQVEAAGKDEVTSATETFFQMLRLRWSMNLSRCPQKATCADLLQSEISWLLLGILNSQTECLPLSQVNWSFLFHSCEMLLSISPCLTL